MSPHSFVSRESLRGRIAKPQPVPMAALIWMATCAAASWRVPLPHRLNCPVHGTESLGSWLRVRGQLGDVRTYFAQVGLYEELIESHKITIFQGKAIVVSDVETIRQLTTAVVKVCSAVACAAIIVFASTCCSLPHCL